MKDDCYVVAALFMCSHVDKLRCPTLMLCSAEPGVCIYPVDCATGFTHSTQQGLRPLEYINAYSEGDMRAKSTYGYRCSRSNSTVAIRHRQVACCIAVHNLPMRTEAALGSGTDEADEEADD